MEFGKTFYIGDFKAKLYPAGHMLGSAGIKLWLENGTLFYTGDTKWFKLRTAEKSRFPRADVLIIEATFGVPSFTFPSPREAEKKLVAFVEEALDRGGKRPTLYVNQMGGKAQEVMKILDVHGITVRPSREMLKVARFIQNLGSNLETSPMKGRSFKVVPLPPQGRKLTLSLGAYRFRLWKAQAEQPRGLLGADENHREGKARKSSRCTASPGNFPGF